MPQIDFDWKAAAVLALLNVPVFVMIGALFFGGWKTFKRALYYGFTPFAADLLMDELAEDMGARTMLLLFGLFCLIIVGVEYIALNETRPDVLVRIGGLLH